MGLPGPPWVPLAAKNKRRCFPLELDMIILGMVSCATTTQSDGFEDVKAKSMLHFVVLTRSGSTWTVSGVVSHVTACPFKDCVRLAGVLS
jgi:hypothetical protein